MDGQTLESQLTFAEHVHELRRRLTWPALILIIGGTVGYIFHDRIITFLKAPLHQTLYYNTPAGGFNFIMKVCMMLGLTLAIPALIYNLVSFIEPAVDKTITKRLIIMVTSLSLVLGVAGAAFAYFSVLPMSLKFFGGIKVQGLSPLISADDYLNFALTCIITFILLFQIPLLVLFINHIRPMSPRKMLKYEKYVIVGSLALALVLPFTYDPITQFLIAVPIILLYNLSVLMVWLSNRKKHRPTNTAKVVEASDEAANLDELVDEPEPARPEPRLISTLAKLTLPKPQVVMATPVAAGPSVSVPARGTFMEPVLSKPLKRQPVTIRRPILDVGRPLQRGNFLDLRPNK